MAHCIQFISPEGQPLGLSQLDNDIRRHVFGLPPDGEHFCAAFILVHMLTSPGGLQPREIANEKNFPENVRRVAEYLVNRGITSRGWQQGADGRLIRWITPRDDNSRGSSPPVDLHDTGTREADRERRLANRRLPSCPDSL